MDSNSIIQCTSSSSHALIATYDVFVSFRGEDTRNNFTAFLFQALRRSGIHAFKDDEDIKKGESIAPELLEAIEGSRIFIAVFSKNYASSTWCLRELVEICKCIKTSPRRVLPIFYDVNPSEVRKQSGCYEKAFTKHEERFKEDKEKMEEVRRWREALTKVANLSGWDIGNKPQPTEIEQIVQNIKKILGPKFSSLPNDHLVGMESRVGEFEQLLRLGSDADVRVVGISGMSGIGKTTLCHALYEKISHQYDFCCFIDDVSKIYRDSNTLGVQKQLLSECLNEKNQDISNVSDGTCLIWTKLRNVRALIVLDNVDHFQQLKMFTGKRETLLRECLGGGSRIIIISRDQHILNTYGVDEVYQVQPLNKENAFKLFCRTAFKDNYIVDDYEKLIHDVLSHAQGHPLAIEVMAKSLFGGNVSQWRSALARLRDNKSNNIMDVLRISFNELDDIDKEIFLDVACFFAGYGEQQLMEILDFRGFYPEHGLKVLVNKSLITINNGTINMHGLLRDLGMCIVQEISPKEPRMWNRLWNYQDLHKVMSENLAAENLEAIVVQPNSWRFPETKLGADALSKIRKLKLLIIEHVNFSGSLNFLSNELGYLTWEKYPFESLPLCFQPHKLVDLFLRESNIKQLWEGTKPLHNLRRLDLSHSKKLIKMPNFGDALNLESLNFQGCVQLRQIDPSIGVLKKLTILNFKDCKSLTKLPHFGEALNLKTLNLEGCIQLRQIDLSIGLLRKLTVLNLKDCKDLVSLPNSILELNSLEYLSLSGCSKLYNIQSIEEPRDAKNLKKLRIDETASHSQSTSSFIKRWLQWPLHLLYARTHKDSVSCFLTFLPLFSCMRELDLSFCNLLQIPDAIGNLHCLEKLNLRGNNFATLANLKELPNLLLLNLQHCKQLKYLPDLPSRTNLPSPSCVWPRSFEELALDETISGLNIFSCPELIEKEHCNKLCFSWMMQIVQAHHQYKHFEYPMMLWPPLISSIIPGNEIPNWFNNQHVGMGSFINIDASHFLQHDNNWIGIAFNVVFMVPNERVMGPPQTERDFIVPIPLLFRGDLITDESDHMWLFYFTRSTFEIICRFHGPKLEFIVVGGQGFYVEVKKYAYRWVYEQDLHPSNLAIMHSENSLPRKRKFLSIEENK